MLKGGVLWRLESTNAKRIWEQLKSQFPQLHTHTLIDIYEAEFLKRADNPFTKVYLDFVKELRAQANANHKRVCDIISNL